MTPSVAAVAALADGVAPHDEVEAAHLADARDWLASTEDVFRRVAPVIPPHLSRALEKTSF